MSDRRNVLTPEALSMMDAIARTGSFAGAARELGAAIIVNPFDHDQMTQALHRALTMTLAERQHHWRAMMAVLRDNSIDHWVERYLAALRSAPQDAGPPGRRHILLTPRPAAAAATSPGFTGRSPA